MAAAWDFITLDEVKAYLKISSAAQDAFLGSLISDTCKWIEDYVRGPVAEQTFTGLLCNGNGLSTIVSPKKPVLRLAGSNEVERLQAIQYRTDPLSGWQNLVDDSRYVLINPYEPYKITLYGAVFPVGIQNIKLNIVAGHVTVPGELRRVAIEAVAEQWAQSRQGLSRLGLASEGVSQAGGSATTSFERLFEQHKKTLDRYVWRYA